MDRGCRASGMTDGIAPRRRRAERRVRPLRDPGTIFVVNKPGDVRGERARLHRAVHGGGQEGTREACERSKRAKTCSDGATSIREAFDSLARLGSDSVVASLHRTHGCLGIACDKETNRILSRAFQEGRVRRHVAHCINTKFADDSQKKWKDWEVSTLEWRELALAAEVLQFQTRVSHGTRTVQARPWRLYARRTSVASCREEARSEAREPLCGFIHRTADEWSISRLQSFPVVAELITGRTHQIRMHCRSIFPSSETTNTGTMIRRMMTWSRRSARGHRCTALAGTADSRWQWFSRHACVGSAAVVVEREEWGTYDILMNDSSPKCSYLY